MSAATEVAPCQEPLCSPIMTGVRTRLSSPRHPKRGTHRAGSGHEPTRLALESFPRIPPGPYLLFAQKKTAAVQVALLPL
jgi:hypothetical protein